MKKIFATAFTALATLAQADDAKMTDPIYEIAIQEVKPGMEAEWKKRRAMFLDALSTKDGNDADWTLPAFFTFPEPGPNPVYVGITRWLSMDDFAAASEELLPSKMAQDFFETVNMQAFVQVSPADGNEFVLEDYIHSEGQVLEVAVRTPKPGKEAEFDEARQAFFDKVAMQPGYVFDREFVSSDGERVVLIGWETQEAFSSALAALSEAAEMGAFFGILDVVAYQAALFE